VRVAAAEVIWLGEGVVDVAAHSPGVGDGHAPLMTDENLWYT
jgi:hypothetical protein